MVEKKKLLQLFALRVEDGAIKQHLSARALSPNPLCSNCLLAYKVARAMSGSRKRGHIHLGTRYIVRNSLRISTG